MRRRAADRALPAAALRAARRAFRARRTLARRAPARLARSAWAGARALVRRVRAFSQGLSLRWKIAAALAGGCALVAVTIGLLIHQARAAQLVTTARESATAQLVRVRQLYELTGQVDQSDADAAVDDGRLPSALRESALAGRRSTFVELDGPDPAVWAARPIGGQVLSVRLPLTVERADLREFDRELVAWGALVVALAALGGAGLASRLSRELRTAAPPRAGSPGANSTPGSASRGRTPPATRWRSWPARSTRWRRRSSVVLRPSSGSRPMWRTSCGRR